MRHMNTVTMSDNSFVMIDSGYLFSLTPEMVT